MGIGEEMSELITVSDSGYGEYSEKKSKFIGRVKHVTSVEEADEFIHSIRSRYWDARHHVYAYVIGKNGESQRSSDDGEPSGTAGRPILEILKGEGLTDVVCVVTRYFGGVLLGTGGLVRAYGKAAKNALDDSEKVRAVSMKLVAIYASYDLSGKIEHFLIQHEITIDHIDYQNNVVIYCLLPIGETESFPDLLSEQFQQRIHCKMLSEEISRFLPVDHQ